MIVGVPGPGEVELVPTQFNVALGSMCASVTQISNLSADKMDAHFMSNFEDWKVTAAPGSNVISHCDPASRLENLQMIK